MYVDNCSCAVLIALSIVFVSTVAMISVEIPRSQIPLDVLLAEILPPDALPPPSGFEEIGHVIHLNLRAQHLPYRNQIGKILLKKFGPENGGRIRSVVNKVGEVGGPFRTFEFEVIAGNDDDFNIELVEDGTQLNFDMRNVYWCSRLAGERKRMLEQEFFEGQVIADAFCGVGALIVTAAKKLGCKVIANDLNPDAVKYVKQNAEHNLIPSENFHVECGDARDFIRSLGTKGKALPDHLILNFPLDSCSFLDQLRWWPSNGYVETLVHVYTFARSDSETDRSQETVAVDMIADNLLPEGGYSEKTKNRQDELDKLGCMIRVHEVRDVAPGKVVLCVSFKATGLLIKHMQGEFIPRSYQAKAYKAKSYHFMNRERARMKRNPK